MSRGGGILRFSHMAPVHRRLVAVVPGRPPSRTSRPPAEGERMRRRIPTLLATTTLALALAAPAAASAQTQVIDFTSLVGSPDYTDIPQSTGDIAGVLEVSNRTRTTFGNAATTNCSGGLTNAEFWNTNYSDLVGIAFSCINGQVAEFAFLPAAGYQVTLNSMDFGSYAAGANGIGPSRPFTLALYDGLWASLLTSPLVANSRLTVSPGITSTNGLYLQWGSDWDVGIDNISVTVSPIGVSAVPEPASVLLLASGLAAVAGVARRRRA
jgi:hypothetical protein